MLTQSALLAQGGRLQSYKPVGFLCNFCGIHARFEPNSAKFGNLQTRTGKLAVHEIRIEDTRLPKPATVELASDKRALSDS
jgi:hypothetical protein